MNAPKFPPEVADGDLIRATLYAERVHRDSGLFFRGPRPPVDLTLGELVGQARTVAGALQSLGVRRGDTVAVHLPNWAEGAVAQVASILSGALTLPVLPTLGVAEVEFILRQSGTRVLFAPARRHDSEYGSVIAEVAARCGVQRTVLVGADEPVAGTVSWSEVVGSGSAWAEPAVGPDDLALLVYTSGTTGEPKGVQRTHRSLLAEMAVADGIRPVGPAQIQLGAFPAGHVAGVLDLLAVVLCGSSAVQMDGWNADQAAALIEEFGVTVSTGAPIFLSSLLDAAERTGRKIGTLQRYVVGAAAVPPSLVLRAERAGIKTYRCYGSSEHPTVTAGDPADPPDVRAENDGYPLPGSEVRIVDAEGLDVGPGVDGEILTRGPEQFVGYRDPRHDAGVVLEGGWIRSGDIGRLNERGALTVTDRIKDLIVRGGENISSREVEDVLAAHPDIAEVAVVAAPDERLGECVCAVVVPRPGAVVTMETLAAHVRASGYAVFKAPGRLEIVSALPRTASGKVKKFELRAHVRGQGSSSAGW